MKNYRTCATVVQRFRRELLPAPRDFYRQELKTLRRPSRGWATALCPFHVDHHPSLRINLTTGGFCCFPCGARGGDILAFVMLRDAINFKEAAKLLGAWDDRTFSDAERTNLKAQRAERIHVQAAAEEVEIEARRLRLEAGDWLRLLDRVKRRASDGLYAIHRGDGRDAEIFWGLLADLAPQIRTAIATYSLLAFGSCADVETFISHPEARSNMIERILSAGFVRDDAGRRVEVEL